VATFTDLGATRRFPADSSPRVHYLAAVDALQKLARERFGKSVLASAVRWVLQETYLSGTQRAAAPCTLATNYRRPSARFKTKASRTPALLSCSETS
jgi:hypothetical protein